MSSCPTCNREYSDETMRFCLDDGTQLVQTGSTRGADATWQLPDSVIPPATIRSTKPPAEQRATVPAFGEPELPPAPAPTAGQPAAPRRSPALLFVLGAVILGAAAVAVAFIATRNRGQESNANQLASASPGPAADAFGGGASTSAPNSNDTSTETKSTTPKESSTASQKAAESPAPSQEPVRKEVKTVYVPRDGDLEAPEPPKEKNEAAEPYKVRPGTTISGGVLNGKATYLAKPAYPAIAKSVRASGSVQVQVTIDESGNVISASAVSGHPLLRGSAVSAARASKFNPTKLSGQPVKVTGVIVYNFVPE